ncbi:ABSCISIC ACID-INSENSITIVE 5-like protein 7 [Tripterygium wilfordii]|uniref:ABSCISIC ACID-INSENSITIVE 5-like protein 7 n=1 Tax=Tripterygium wilfordii TaxID=458696 RepID=A0A7J7CDL5_TRIWF|nr:bZIP transcription factor 12-like [Tripterygium wilfordii]KAF5731977.1 ABSCISIC ACID-INSENSITIVE 5-like protein 7 [Tripterygium wilfordii]
MASSRVMATTSTTNHELPRESSLCPSVSSLLADLQQQQQQESLDPTGDPLVSSMSMDDLLKNIYASASPPPQVLTESQAPFPSAPDARDGDGCIGNTKSVEEVWKEIVAGGNQRLPVTGGGPGEITLEDFLTKAGAVSEEDVRMHNQVEARAAAVYTVDASVGYANGGIGTGETVRRGGKRRVEERPLDKATQQKQRRMIKNRESAARSRERKQAYTVELEALVSQLEEENAQLLKEEAEQNKERFKQLVENLVPVVEKRKPPRVLRRVHSLQW